MLAAQTLKIHIDGDECAYRITLAVEGGAAPSGKSRREPLGSHGRRQRIAVLVGLLCHREVHELVGRRRLWIYKLMEVVPAQSPLADQVPNVLGAGWPRRCAGR